jgi:hypothetical protein
MGAHCSGCGGVHAGDQGRKASEVRGLKDVAELKSRESKVENIAKTYSRPHRSMSAPAGGAKRRKRKSSKRRRRRRTKQGYTKLQDPQKQKRTSRLRTRKRTKRSKSKSQKK